MESQVIPNHPYLFTEVRSSGSVVQQSDFWANASLN